jgi:ectoine hydroxylase-related dioxygenase (phytanoyl-CoA dioxygenase family)
MIALDISREEIQSRKLSASHLEAAVSAIETDGFVVVNDVVDVAHLDILREKMLHDVHTLINRPDAPFNWNPGNIQQDPPPFPPYLFHDVLLNDMVIAVTQAILGNGVKNTFYSGNTAMPSRHRQPVHADCGHLWPRMKIAHPPHALVVNVPVVGVSAHNGSTEIWPGTHLDVTVAASHDIELPHEVIEQQRAQRPPIQPDVRLGGALIRDMRLWHAGMPNRSDQPRPMIAMIHQVGWIEAGLPLQFPTATESFFADSPLKTCARFSDEASDYLHTGHGYKSPQENV